MSQPPTKKGKREKKSKGETEGVKTGTVPTNRVKPRADRYTVMLLISLIAMIIAVIFLYLEVASHGPDPLSGIPRAQILMPVVQEIFGPGLA
ncbi:MAG: hypothetical protein ACRC10_11365 [Thermoguttaceae bacterium]